MDNQNKLTPGIILLHIGMVILYSLGPAAIAALAILLGNTWGSVVCVVFGIPVIKHSYSYPRTNSVVFNILLSILTCICIIGSLLVAACVSIGYAHSTILAGFIFTGCLIAIFYMFMSFRYNINKESPGEKQPDGTNTTDDANSSNDNAENEHHSD